MHVIEQGSLVVIEPTDINIDGDKGFTGFWGTFNSGENESAAAFLVYFAQKRGSWNPFTQDEIEMFYQGLGHRGFRLMELVKDGFIIEADGGYCFTYKFVGRAYGSSPAI